MARALRELRGGRGDDELVFTSGRGKLIDASNLMGRVLKPAAVRAGLGEWVVSGGRKRARTWVGFHTLRHTCATSLFRGGANAKQVQMWLGHHSPAFTLATYVHLLPDDLPDAAFLDTITALADGQQKGNKTTPDDPRSDVTCFRRKCWLAAPTALTLSACLWFPRPLNPKVAGSNPARPTRKDLVIPSVRCLDGRR